MDILNQVVLGLLAVVAGVAGLKFNFQLVNFTGDVGFAERYLGAGGTYSLFKILGVVLVIGGLLFAVGLGAPVVQWLLTPIINIFPKPTGN